MKKKSHNRIFGIFLLITCFSCQQFNGKGIVANEFGNVDSTFVEQIIPKKIEFTSGISLSTDMEKELLLFEYFNTKYVYFLNDFQFVNEKLYNANLFNNQRSSIFVKQSKKYDDELHESTYRYIYEQSKIKNIIDDNISISFYYDNNKLARIIKNNSTIPLVKTEEHKKTLIPATKYIWERKFEYSNNRLISCSESRTDRFESEKDAYFQGNINEPSDYYFKKVHNNGVLDGSREIYGFKSGEIQIHATYSKNENYPWRFITYSKEGDMITAKRFERISSSSIVEYELRFNYVIQVTGDKKLERVVKTEINSSKPGYVTDFYYEYIYSGDELVGYNIFSRKYEYSGKNSNNTTTDYDLDEYFQRTD